MTSYESAVERLYALGHELQHGPSRKFDLAHMRILCQALGNPQRNFPSVLIAGTNGKGSTAATLASILQASAHRVGLYTSPHLLRINERISRAGRADCRCRLRRRLRARHRRRRAAGRRFRAAPSAQLF